MIQNHENITETLAHVYSSESEGTQWELSNDYQQERV